MRLLEMKKLPQRAGLAKLNFQEVERWDQVGRENDVITLARDPLAELFLIKKGEQFIFCHGESVYFGGTDEQPFFVQVKRDLLCALLRDGEQGFYDALKPEQVKRTEQTFKVQAKRQGDIFAVPVPYSWEQISRGFVMLTGEDGEIYETEGKYKSPFRVFGTRHVLKGKCTSLNQMNNGSYYGDNPLYAEGVIEAPDHSPLKLKGVHLLAQAEGLVRPSEAD